MILQLIKSCFLFLYQFHTPNEEFDQSALVRKTDQGPDGGRTDVGGSTDDNSTRKNDTLPSRDASESTLCTLINMSYFHVHYSKHLNFK